MYIRPARRPPEEVRLQVRLQYFQSRGKLLYDSQQKVDVPQCEDIALHRPALFQLILCLSFNQLRPIVGDRHRNTWMRSFFSSPLLLLLIQSHAAWAVNDTFKADCKKLFGTGKVVVTYTDIVAAEDSSHTIKSLQAMSGKTYDAYHSVYGLTRAEPEFRYEIRSRWRIRPEGETCIVSDISIKLGFSAMRVYLARELQDSCRRNIVREHELEHVSAWRSHFEIGAKMLEEPLGAAFSQPRYYVSQTQAQADLKPWVEGVLHPFQKQLMNGAAAAQRAIDSPAAYERVKQRLRACPPSVNGIL